METTNGKKSELRLDKASKVLFAMVQGSFKPEDANEFIVAYNANVAQINATEYELRFDCTALKVTTQDMVPMLSACFEMYKKDGFLKTVFDCGTNATLRLQCRRIGNLVGLQNFDIL
jgi:hypothetical protein